MPPATSIPPNNKVNSSTVPYGNYTSYYSKRRDALQRGDDRLASLPPDFFLGKRVLDLGCNSGFVSVEIGE
jgi:7SK snRNA methylphosphate capping enzyme